MYREGRKKDAVRERPGNQGFGLGKKISQNLAGVKGNGRDEDKFRSFSSGIIIYF